MAFFGEALQKALEEDIKKEDAEKFEGMDEWLGRSMTGWDAYLALEKVLLRWHILSGEEYAAWLASSLRGDSALMDDWARAVKSALRERYKPEDIDKTKDLSWFFADRDK